MAAQVVPDFIRPFSFIYSGFLKHEEFLHLARPLALINLILMQFIYHGPPRRIRTFDLRATGALPSVILLTRINWVTYSEFKLSGRY